MAINDRRPSGSSKGSESRRRFLERQRRHLTKGIDKFLKGKGLKDIKDADTVKGTASKDRTRLKSPRPDQTPTDIVFTGNKRYTKGDQIAIPQKSGGKGIGKGEAGDGLSEDEFEFIMTKDEFRDLLFADLDIPNFLKRSGKGEMVDEFKKAGFTKRGVPGRLHLLKTYEQAIGRCMAEGKEDIQLEEEDLRYRNIVVKTRPVKKAIMFCVMDVSGSMGEEEKMLAKKFYILMYLFLTHKYTAVDVRFIRYHNVAREVDEEEFFGGRETGGTFTSKALELVQEIIDSDYDLELDNIYVTLASDGGEWDLDAAMRTSEDLMSSLNYLAYIEVAIPSQWSTFMQGGTLYSVYKTLADKFKDSVGSAFVRRTEDIPNALRELFRSNRR